MLIHNVRVGFATNSSSSHSIVILQKGEKLLPDTDGDMWQKLGYGWENFVLSTSETKEDYLAVALYAQLKEQVGHDIAATIVNEWIGKDYDSLEESFIDHASRMHIPRDPKTNQINKEFWKQFVAYMKRDNVMILGGNDNTGSPEAWEIYTDRNRLARSADAFLWNDMVALQIGDELWACFNQATGAKLRISFAENPVELKSSVVPELVDMKITNYCGAGCSFCYQDSSYRGNHADLDTVERYLYNMATMGVLEVALGGGEPVLHPDFIDILAYARKKGITPNFTTKRLYWRDNIVSAVKEHVGAFAYSVESARDVYELNAFRQTHDLRATAQFILGAYPPERLEPVARAAKETRLTLTLLGYKHIGRAKDTLSYSHPDWIQQILDADCNVGVDTVIVEEHGDALKESGIADILMTPGEGRFSMYIDAVSEKAGISSYHLDSFIDCKPGYTDKAWDKLRFKGATIN